MTILEAWSKGACAFIGLAFALSACGGTETGSEHLDLDTDGDGDCESNDLSSFDTSCGDNGGACPVPKLSDAECTAACANAVALRDKMDPDYQDCFVSLNSSRMYEDGTCEFWCNNSNACFATFAYCYKDAKTCTEVKQCRIDHL